MPKKWIKVPRPGQFRGEGHWEEMDMSIPSQKQDWEYCVSTGYLPTAEQDEKPNP